MKVFRLFHEFLFYTVCFVTTRNKAKKGLLLSVFTFSQGCTKAIEKLAGIELLKIKRSADPLKTAILILSPAVSLLPQLTMVVWRKEEETENVCANRAVLRTTINIIVPV